MSDEFNFHLLEAQIKFRKILQRWVMTKMRAELIKIRKFYLKYCVHYYLCAQYIKLKGRVQKAFGNCKLPWNLCLDW